MYRGEDTKPASFNSPLKSHWLSVKFVEQHLKKKIR